MEIYMNIINNKLQIGIRIIILSLVQLKMELKSFKRKIGDYDFEAMLTSQTLMLKVRSEHDSCKSSLHTPNSNPISTNLLKLEQKSQRNIAKKKCYKRNKTYYYTQLNNDNIPSQCKTWFENIDGVFQALTDEEQVQIVTDQTGVQVRINFVVMCCNKAFRRVSKFMLEVAVDQEEVKEEVQEKDKEMEMEGRRGQKWKGRVRSNQIRGSLTAGLNQQMSENNQTLSNASYTRQILDKLIGTLSLQIKNLKVRQRQNVRQIKLLKIRQTDTKSKVEQMALLYTNKMSRQKPLTFVKPAYHFSERYRHKSVDIISQKGIISRAKDQCFKCVLINPNCFEIGTNIHSQVFQIQLKVVRLGKYISFGICQKSKVMCKKYSTLDTDVKNHGLYVIDWNGQAWSDYLQQESAFASINDIRFRDNDIIKMVFKTNCKRLTFYKNDIQSFEMTINPSIPLKNLCFVAIISGQNDEVQIVTPDLMKEVIDLQQEQPYIETKMVSNRSIRNKNN